MPIRIMHVVDSLGKGGLENGLINLINRLDTRRFDHSVCAIRQLGENASRLPADRVEVICLGKKERHSRFQAPMLVRAIRQLRPDIVHSRNWPGIEAVFAARACRCAVVHSEHGLEADPDKREPWRRTWLRRIAFELSDRVLSVSGQLKELHARRTGFPAHRITVIHNGVDNGLFSTDPVARGRTRQELGLSESDFCIGCVANLLPVKDHLTLLRALEVFDASCSRWRLLLVGEGSERHRLEAFVKARPEWKTRVTLLGSRNSVPELLNAFDVYVLPSLIEGISNSLLEAMATGLPVITTAAGGNPEVVGDGTSGMLFPVGNFRQLAQQLLLLRSDGNLRLRLGEQARQRVRDKFSIDAMVRQYDELYGELRPILAVPLRTAIGV